MSSMAAARLALVTFLLASGWAAAQQPSATQQPSAAPAVTPSPDLAGIAHVAVRVSDLDASIAFYQKLGFVEAFSLSRDNKVYEAFIKINDRQFLELYPTDAGHTQIGFLHLCYEGKDLAAAHDFYVAHGLTPNAVRTAGAGNLLFTMPGPASPTGPENMEYTQYRPGSLHSKDAGQHLGAERIATEMVSVTLAVDQPAAAREFYVAKAGFLPTAGKSLMLPGGSGESIEFVPAATLGFRSRIALRLDNLAKAEAMLKAHSIPFTHEASGLRIIDPDENQIDLETRP